MNWATGVDMKTGRPIETPEARYGETGRPFIAQPGPGGAHSWQPMSYSPRTGPGLFPGDGGRVPVFPGQGLPQAHAWRGIPAWTSTPGACRTDQAVLEQIKAGLKGISSPGIRSRSAKSGACSTSIRGTAGRSRPRAISCSRATRWASSPHYDARTGAKLWSMATGTGILAPPVTYLVGGEQYVAIEVGWGGAFGLAAGELARDAHIATNAPRVFAFKLGGRPRDAAARHRRRGRLEPPPDVATAATVEAGKATYHRYCGTCHGDSAVSTGVLPDLRYSAYLGDADAFARLVRDGVLAERGMIAFGAGALRRGCRADPRLRDPPRARNEARGCGRGRAFRRRAGVNRARAGAWARGDG